MPTYAVRYTYAVDSGATRDSVRPAHHAYLRSRPELLGSGAFVGGDAGALLVFEATDAAALDAILAADPFAQAGVITSTDVREWKIVSGRWSES